MTTYSQIIEQAAEVERSADQLDQASNRSQTEISHLVRENAARVVEQEAAAAAQVIGQCLHCSEPCEPPRRWCDQYCAGSWEADQKASARRGC